MGVLKKTFLKRAEKEAALAAEVDDDSSFDTPEDEQDEDEQESTEEGGSLPPRRLRGAGLSLDSEETCVKTVCNPPVLQPVRVNQIMIENSSEARVRVSADVPMSIHKKLKYYSVATGKTIQTIISEWIIQNCSGHQ